MSGSCCASHKTETKTTVYWDKLVLYRPLIVILGISTCAGIALSVHGVPLMNGMMGAFLLFLSSLKLFNLNGFAEGFARYDTLARYSRTYALLYPLIELGLGCFYLSGGFPIITNMMTVLVMSIGSIGVIQIIRSRTSVSCACVGTGFNLPVGFVTLAENTVMALMALINITTMGVH